MTSLPVVDSGENGPSSVSSETGGVMFNMDLILRSVGLAHAFANRMFRDAKWRQDVTHRQQSFEKYMDVAMESVKTWVESVTDDEHEDIDWKNEAGIQEDTSVTEMFSDAINLLTDENIPDEEMVYFANCVRVLLDEARMRVDDWLLELPWKEDVDEEEG